MPRRRAGRAAVLPCSTALSQRFRTPPQAKFAALTRRRGFQKVQGALESALEYADAGRLKVKINCVVMRGTNEQELADFVRLTADKPELNVRFIEWYEHGLATTVAFRPPTSAAHLPPLTHLPPPPPTPPTPRMPFDRNAWNDDQFLGYRAMLQELAAAGLKLAPVVAKDPSDTTKWYRAEGLLGRVGFITSMSEHFCGTCNRLRITADGKLKVCLFGRDEFDLKVVLRRGTGIGGDEDDEEGGAWDLDGLIAHALQQKHFSLGGHDDMYGIAGGENRPMILIGG